MEAKLIRVIEAPPNRSWYFREYEYECIRCGEHFFRHTHTSRINPYCSKCYRENERIKRKSDLLRKKKQIEVDILMKVRSELIKQIKEERYGTLSDMVYEDGLEGAVDVIDKYINEGIIYGKGN